jgi:hypothetical protein
MMLLFGGPQTEPGMNYFENARNESHEIFPQLGTNPLGHSIKYTFIITVTSAVYLIGELRNLYFTRLKSIFINRRQEFHFILAHTIIVSNVAKEAKTRIYRGGHSCLTHPKNCSA